VTAGVGGGGAAVDPSSAGTSLSAETLLALHDPTAVLLALGDRSDAEEAERGRFTVVLDAGDAGDDLLQQALEQTGAQELTVTTEVEADRVTRLHYDVRSGPSVPAGGTGEPDGGTAGDATGDAGTQDEAASRGGFSIVVTFDSFGGETVTVPDDADTASLADVLGDLVVDLGLGQEIDTPVQPGGSGQAPAPGATGPGSGDEDGDSAPPAGSGDADTDTDTDMDGGN
jgi:hypothetical protein